MKENEKDRMRKLTQSFETQGEIFKEEREETNAEKLQEDYKRLSELSSGEKNAGLREGQRGNFMGGNDSAGGQHAVNQGKSVSTIVDSMYENPTQYQGAQGNNIALREGEGLMISIRRTLESGAPVNNIAFYDEVNWNLANLGFSSKLPQDIKSAILKMMS